MNGLHKVDCAIVGGGASATALLSNLAGSKLTSSLSGIESVAVLDSFEPCGRGVAWSTRGAHPTHTLGRSETTRLSKGRSLEKEFHSACIALLGKSVAVHSLKRMVRDVSKENDFWSLDIGEIHPLLARYVVLATGHWAPDEENTIQVTYYPWPLTWVDNAIAAPSVLIIGCLQTAIDCAFALAERVGRFVSDATHGVAYHTDHPLRIIMVSRTGRLPRVWGAFDSHCKRTALIFTRKQVQSRMKHGVISLDELTSLFFSEMLGESVSVSFEQCVSFLNEQLKSRGSVGDLEHSLRVARESRSQKVSISWQSAAIRATNVFVDHFVYLNAADRVRFETHWTSILAHIEAVTLDAGERIHAMLRAGVLQVNTLGEVADIRNIQQVEEFIASIPAWKNSHVVFARGQQARISSKSLLSRLIEKGLARSFMPVSDGVIEFDAGGVACEPSTGLLLDRTGSTQDSLFVMGPLTIGQTPIYGGLPLLRRQSQRIVQYLEKHFMQTPHSHDD